MKFEVDHVSIQTNDFEYAFKFYTKILGFKVVKEPFNFKARRLCLLDTGIMHLELYSGKKDQPLLIDYNTNRGGLDHIAFNVSDIHEAIAYFQANDIKIIKQPFLPKTNDKSQPLVSFIEGPDKQEIEIRQKYQV